MRTAEKPPSSRQALFEQRGRSHSRLAGGRRKRVEGAAVVSPEVRVGVVWYKGADRDHVVQSGRGASLRKANRGGISLRKANRGVRCCTDAYAEEVQKSRELQEKERTQRWKLWRR
jgi:hypothetical protein